MGGQFACEVVSSLSVPGTQGLVLPVLGSGRQDFRPLPIYSVASWQGKDWAACGAVSSEGCRQGRRRAWGPALSRDCSRTAACHSGGLALRARPSVHHQLPQSPGPEEHLTARLSKRLRPHNKCGHQQVFEKV